MTLPSTRFRRTVGSWANVPTNPEGKPVGHEEFAARQDEWLPTGDDRTYVHSLMKGVFERGKWPAGSRRRNVASTLSRSTLNTYLSLNCCCAKSEEFSNRKPETWT